MEGTQIVERKSLQEDEKNPNSCYITPGHLFFIRSRAVGLGYTSLQLSFLYLFPQSFFSSVDFLGLYFFPREPFFADDDGRV